MATPSELNVEIKIDVDGDEDAAEYLKDVRSRMKDLRPVWPRLHQSLKAYMISNFTAQGLPSGGWKPLDAEYASWKTENFPGAPILVQTGELFRQVTQGPKLEGMMRGARFKFTGKIARFHQYGTERMPARPILFAPERWVDEAAEEVVKYIVEGYE
jgi:phage gpG-like protein